MSTATKWRQSRQLSTLSIVSNSTLMPVCTSPNTAMVVHKECVNYQDCEASCVHQCLLVSNYNGIHQWADSQPVVDSRHSSARKMDVSPEHLAQFGKQHLTTCLRKPSDKFITCATICLYGDSRKYDCFTAT